jgi:hypothetical protein
MLRSSTKAISLPSGLNLGINSSLSEGISFSSLIKVAE